MILVGSLNFVFGVVYTIGFSLLDMRGFAGPDQDPTFFWIMRFLMAFNVLSILIGPLMVFGGFGMLKGRNYGWAKAAAILSLIPVTLCFNPFGLIVGIWSVVILSGRDVKDHFAAKFP
jgi:hypothetical protein